MAPCFGCELLQARERSAYYLGDFKVDTEHREQLDALIARFRSQKGRVKKLLVPDVDPTLGRAGPETIRTLVTPCPQREWQRSRQCDAEKCSPELTTVARENRRGDGT